ncbi:PREDICTED: upstream stimulatory factor 1, partial [Chaetura pelagica]|uniref:upstream stimulatory factor 1 n=1 Tax=Chaetura pelagica TaxID=8897 RepID=UPI0005234670
IVVAASLGGTLTYGVYLGLLEMQLILHYDETYREVKYSNIQLEDIDRKVLMGINVTPVAALLYTPLLIRFFGTKWAMFLAVGVYALFVSSNYWERYYTLVPSAVAIGVAIVPLWASMGNYITRMAQKYYEYANYKEEHVQEQQPAPRGACHSYIIIFQTVFYSCFQLSFVCAQMPMFFFLNNYLYHLNHTLYEVKHCGTLSHGTLTGFNKTVLQSLPRSINLIIVESVLMAAAFLAMLLADKRAHHNALERKRRDHIKDSFHSLRDSVPSLQGEKASRAQILDKATEYIQYMRRKNHTHQQDIDDLKRQNALLEQQ